MAIRAYVNALFSYLGIGRLEDKIIHDKKIKKGKTLKTQVERAFAGILVSYIAGDAFLSIGKGNPIYWEMKSKKEEKCYTFIKFRLL